MYQIFHKMSSEYFYKLGCKLTSHKLKHSKKIGVRRFKAFFGVTPLVCSTIWNQIKTNSERGSQPKHLLWCLNFFKQYTGEHTRHVLFKSDEKTIRKWTWRFVKLLADLNVVC